MSKRKDNNSQRQSTESDQLSVLNRVARLIEIMVRLNLQTMKSDRNPAEMITMLDSAGCGRSEIAELLGTTTNAVNVALFRAKRRAGKK